MSQPHLGEVAKASLSTWVFFHLSPFKGRKGTTSQRLVCALHLEIACKARGQPSTDRVPALGPDPSDTARCPRPQGWPYGPMRSHVEAPCGLCLSPWGRARELQVSREERTKAVGPGGIQRCVHSVSSGQPYLPADPSPGASAENVPWKTMVSCLGLSLCHQPHQPPVVAYDFLAPRRSHTHQRQPGLSPQLSPASPLEDHRYLLTGLSAPPGPYRGPGILVPPALSPTS